MGFDPHPTSLHLTIRFGLEWTEKTEGSLTEVFGRITEAHGWRVYSTDAERVFSA